MILLNVSSTPRKGRSLRAIDNCRIPIEWLRRMADPRADT